MGTAHVATIHFHERVVDRKQFQFGTFTLPAVPLGDAPVVIAIPDKIQIDRGPFKDSMRGNQRSVVKFPETGQVIAHDIVKECTASGLGMTEGCHPGTWVVRESMPLLYEQDVFENGRLIAAQGTHQKDAEGGALWRPATDEEKAVMWAEDLADAVCGDANLSRQLRRADAKFSEFISKNFAGMDWCTCHWYSFSDSPRSRRSMDHFVRQNLGRVSHPVPETTQASIAMRTSPETRAEATHACSRKSVHLAP